MTPNDSRMANRIVGFLEYRMALANFEALLSMVDEYELKAIDELVSEKEEFAVYTNLSRLLELRPSSLSEHRASENDNFKRRGFAWVIALARVEVGAIMASHTNVPRPFAIVGPGRYEAGAYLELILDGARTHYAALARDPNLRRMKRISPRNTQVLAYSRRMVLALSMLRNAMQAGSGHYNVQQVAELNVARKELIKATEDVIANIHSYLQSGVISRRSSKTERASGETYLTRVCGQIIHGIHTEARTRQR